MFAFREILQVLRSPKPLPHEELEEPIVSKTQWFRVNVEYGQSDGFHFACSQTMAMAIGTTLGTVIVPFLLWFGAVSMPYSICLLMTKMGTVNANNLCNQVVTPAAPVNVEGASPLQ